MLIPRAPGMTSDKPLPLPIAGQASRASTPRYMNFTHFTALFACVGAYTATQYTTRLTQSTFGKNSPAELKLTICKQEDVNGRSRKNGLPIRKSTNPYAYEIRKATMGA